MLNRNESEDKPKIDVEAVKKARLKTVQGGKSVKK